MHQHSFNKNGIGSWQDPIFQQEWKRRSGNETNLKLLPMYTREVLNWSSLIVANFVDIEVTHIWIFPIQVLIKQELKTVGTIRFRLPTIFCKERQLFDVC